MESERHEQEDGSSQKELEVLYLEATDAVLGCKPATTLPVLIDTLLDGVVVVTTNEESEQGSPFTASIASEQDTTTPPRTTQDRDSSATQQLSKPSSTESSGSSTYYSTTVKMLNQSINQCSVDIKIPSSGGRPLQVGLSGSRQGVIYVLVKFNIARHCTDTEFT